MILHIIYQNDVYKMFQLKDDKKQTKILEEMVVLIPGLKLQDNKVYCQSLLCAKMITAYFRSEIYDN